MPVADTEDLLRAYAHVIKVAATMPSLVSLEFSVAFNRESDPGGNMVGTF